MAFVTLIVPQEFLSVPTHGTIQYHPSLLPRHRGRSAINWPVIKGETETGLTVFWPDGGIDTGDVLLQRTTPISETDTLGSVYFDRLFPMGVEALLEAVDLVAAGTAPADPAGRVAGDLRGAVRAARTRASTGASRAGSSTTSSAAATRRRGPGPPAAARPCRSSRLRRSRPATSRASAARWERWPPSTTTASASSAPTAACA